MYKTLQLFTDTFTFNTTNLEASKLLKTHMYIHQHIKNAKLFKAWIKLKLFIVLGLMTSTDVLKVLFLD